MDKHYQHQCLIIYFRMEGDEWYWKWWMSFGGIQALNKPHACRDGR